MVKISEEDKIEIDDKIKDYDLSDFIKMSFYKSILSQDDFEKFKFSVSISDIMINSLSKSIDENYFFEMLQEIEKFNEKFGKKGEEIFYLIKFSRIANRLRDMIETGVMLDLTKKDDEIDSDSDE